MKSEELFQILGGIDVKFVEKASEELVFWQESQKGISVRLDSSPKFAWKTMLASVACTAVVMFGVFALLLNTGTIEITDSPASSGTEFDFRSDSQIGSLPELNPASGSQSETFSDNTVYPDTILFEEAVYAYDTEDSDEIKRYTVGDIFGEYAKITHAKSVYKISDGKAVLQRQEIILEDRHYHLSGGRIETDGTTFINVYIESLNNLGLPVIEKDFTVQPFRWSLQDKKTDCPSLEQIDIWGLIIAVDYGSRTITAIPQFVAVSSGEYDEFE